MVQRKTVAAVLCLAVLSGAATLWLVHQHKAARERAETARLFRAAKAGDARAQYRIGARYYYGTGVPQNYAEAVRWYRQSAGQGNASAQYALGYCYYHGCGVAQDKSEAARWFRKAADQGYAWAETILGYMCSTGEDVPRDYAEGTRLFHKAAEQGDELSQA